MQYDTSRRLRAITGVAEKALTDYIEARINELHLVLERAQGEFPHVQGQISELRRLSSALASAKVEPENTSGY